MIFNRHMFRRAAIIGTGMIGGSLALALKKHGLVGSIIGVSRQEASLKTAVEMKAIDESTMDIHKAIQGADLVILAAPVKVILDNIEDISKHLRRGCIVTDVGSTKLSIVDLAEKHFPPHVMFVGSHPMAGSEKSGISHANADLFKGAACIMTPTAKTNRMARDKVKQLWTIVGAQVKLMEPAAHDEALAYVSHLPHMLAFSLARAIPEAFLEHGAIGLKDTTRLAGSSSKMWSDICISNYRQVIKAIDESVKSLADIRKAVVAKDEQELVQIFNQAKTKREILEKKING
ncbi:MAG: prephenate dehydrogenase/arogenate dehydrogenase family protein [Candidatus Omnitrophica bacterium]|nr:prephenate dehydrogenase/arogenate dehydrogenase family protein [Candidatus Omnitrophota bacterium]